MLIENCQIIWMFLMRFIIVERMPLLVAVRLKIHKHKWQLRGTENILFRGYLDSITGTFNSHTFSPFIHYIQWLQAHMDRIKPPDELGFMILSEDGRLVDSGGALKNRDRVAKIIFQMKNALEASSGVLNDNVHSVTIQYEDHLYVLVFEPRRSLVLKRRRSTSPDLMA